ncbi:MAG TPA: hypothetical protein VFP55_06325 [Solirubrobacteraceae bacterium]|nr:hypothetical protein [Solirubrobacteraceae bacterium]
MARCLIIGCGCHGQRLARALRDRGHVVRGTTRRTDRLADIEANGAEPVLADPDRLGTLVAALDHVSVAVLLLGSADGDAASLAALHGPRLEALLVKLLDTTIRGVVYEAAGSVPGPLLHQGAASVQRRCSASHVPYAVVEADRHSPDWLDQLLGGVDGVLGAR